MSAMSRGVLRAVHLDAAAIARRPARRVPVPAFLLIARGPRHDVRRRRPDLLVAARAPIALPCPARGDMAHHPLPVRMLLGCRSCSADRRRLLQPAPRSAWAHRVAISSRSAEVATAGVGIAAAIEPRRATTDPAPTASSMANGPSG